MSWALGSWRARLSPRLPAPRRWRARRRGPEGADPESEGPTPFSASKASPRVWSVGQSMGSGHERPWVRVLPVSLLGTGLLLWCLLGGKTEIDKRLEAAFSGQDADSAEVAEKSSAPWEPPREK